MDVKIPKHSTFFQRLQILILFIESEVTSRFRYMLTRISSGMPSRETTFLVLDILDCVAMIKDRELGL